MTDNSSPSVILASASQSRAHILKEAGVFYSTEPAFIDEGSIKESLKAEGADALAVTETLAELKAVKISRNHPKALVIGADSILDLDGVWFDKPTDIDHAKSHLKILRGRTHILATTVVVALGGTRIWHFREQSKLRMRNFSDVFLHQYMAAAGTDVLSSVGAYHLEGLGVQLFDQIEGDFFSILGLPLLPLLAFLREYKVVMP